MGAFCKVIEVLEAGKQAAIFSHNIIKNFLQTDEEALIGFLFYIFFFH